MILQNPIISVIYEQARYDDLEAGIRSLALRNRSIPNINPSQLVLADRVQETTSSIGIGNIICNGPISQYQGFSVIGANNNTWYSLVSGDGVNWETGIGTINQLNPTGIARSTVFSSSNGGGLISLSGVSTIFCDMPSSTASTIVASAVTAMPNQVQFASIGSLATSSTSVTVTFSSTPTPGNTIMFIVGNYGGTGAVITPAFTGGLQVLKDQGVIEINEQIAVFILTVGSSPAISYTFNIASPTGTTCAFGAEISGVRNIVSADQVPALSGSVLSGYVLSPDNSLTYVAIENDGGGSASSYTNGLTLVKQITGTAAGHSLAIFKYAGSTASLAQSVTFSPAPNAYNLWNVTSVQS